MVSFRVTARINASPAACELANQPGWIEEISEKSLEKALKNSFRAAFGASWGTAWRTVLDQPSNNLSGLSIYVVRQLLFKTRWQELLGENLEGATQSQPFRQLFRRAYVSSSFNI
jgi:hypothetical protein